MQLVDFDPSNEEHMEAYRSLIQEGRQHPTLRFNVGTFESVPQMMLHRISEHFHETTYVVPPSAITHQVDIHP